MLAHIATVTIVQEHAPIPDTALPRLHGALTSRVVVEQAKGFPAALTCISLAEAFGRPYARTDGMHLFELARALVWKPAASPEILASMSHLAATPGHLT